MIGGYGLIGLNDWYALFKKDSNVNEYITNNIAPEHPFRAKDIINEHTSQSINQGVSKHNRKSVTIITSAQFDFENDDLVLNMKTNELWKIKDVETRDDGNMKKYSNNPKAYYVLTLWR